MRWSSAITDRLVWWILGAAVLGIAVPEATVLEPLVLPALAVMIWSVGLGLAVADFRRVSRTTVAATFFLHLIIPVVAFAVASALRFPPSIVLGFVLLGATTPEFTAPAMTRIARGNTALATTLLILAGFASIVTLPASVTLLAPSTAGVNGGALLAPLLFAVILPLAAGVAVRARWTRQVARHDAAFPAVAALMVVFVMLIAVSSNAPVLRAEYRGLPRILAGAVALNGLGYATGWFGSAARRRGERVAGAMSLGTRDFALAGALVFAAGLPAEAALPAVVFGVVEMVSAAWLAGRLR